MTRSRQKHNYRSWIKSRQREIEAREWGHTNTVSMIVCASTWERGGGRQLQRSRITASVCELGESERERRWDFLSLFTRTMLEKDSLTLRITIPLARAGRFQAGLSTLSVIFLCVKRP